MRVAAEDTDWQIAQELTDPQTSLDHFAPKALACALKWATLNGLPWPPAPTSRARRQGLTV